MNFVPTVIVPPRAPSAFVEREALHALIEPIAASRLTSIRAPAGYGKTTAARFWFDRLGQGGRPGVWISGRAGVDDLRSFKLALHQAGKNASLPWDALDPLADDGAWIAMLAQHGQRLLLAVDDAQLLPRDVLDFLTSAVDRLGDAITVMMVSRGDLGIPVGRIRASGGLVEVTQADLRLSPAESAELLSRLAGSSLGEEMSELVLEADGWVAGLVIAASAQARRNGPHGSRHDVSGAVSAALRAYFQEEVISSVSSAMGDFVEQTCILRELTPAACEDVTGNRDAGTMLEAIYRAGIFIDAIAHDAHRYAYHHQFRQSLAGALAHRSPSLFAELHRRASRHYADCADEMTALHHAELSRDDEFLADQLERMVDALTDAGYLYRIDELGSKLPWPILRVRPRLLLALAWRQIRRLSLSSAERFINTAAAIAETRPQDHSLTQLVRHRRIMLEAARDNMPTVESAAEKLIFELGDDEPYLSGTLLAQLMSARHELYHFKDMVRLEAETRRALGRVDSELAAIMLKATIAPTLVAQGKSVIARGLLEEALAVAQAKQGAGSGLAALPALPLAEIYYDAGELDRAGEIIEQCLPACREWGFVDQLASGYLVQARLAFARGDAATALRGLDEAHLIAVECQLDRFQAFILAERTRIHVKSGRLEEAEAALHAADIRLHGEPVPTVTPTRTNEHHAIAWLRIQMHRNNLNRAEAVAARWLQFMKRNSATRSVVHFQLLLAQIGVVQGNRAKARRVLREAMELAAPSGWKQMFIDEGEIIRSLLDEGYGGNPMLTSPTDAFANELVLLSKGETPSSDWQEEDMGLASSLSDREVEVLNMVGAGLRNQEIGQRLGLTEATAKWYMQQIFDKLGVRRRSQAVIRARQLGVLN